jgi:hypothetical protein
MWRRFNALLFTAVGVSADKHSIGRIYHFCIKFNLVSVHPTIRQEEGRKETRWRKWFYVREEVKSKFYANCRAYCPVCCYACILEQIMLHSKPINAHLLIYSARYYYPSPTYFVGRVSSVCIATRHGLDGPGIESRWGRNFPHLSRPALGLTQPPI